MTYFSISYQRILTYSSYLCGNMTGARLVGLNTLGLLQSVSTKKSRGLKTGVGHIRILKNIAN